MNMPRGRTLTIFSAISFLLTGSLSAFASSAVGAVTRGAPLGVGHGRVQASGPFNSLLNTLPNDSFSAQSETSVAVCDDLTAQNCPTPIVMVAYNDLIPSGVPNQPSVEGVGYSVAFDGGTRWTDEGTLPYYQDTSGLGHHAGDPALTVDSNGVFYFADVEFTHDGKEFIGMSTCQYSASVGIACSRPLAITTPTKICLGGKLNLGGYQYDKPGITYDPVNNRVYITWTYYSYNSCIATSEVPQFAYYDVASRTLSQIYTAPVSGPASGTAPVASGGTLYVFYENFGSPNTIQYFTFNNGSMSGPNPVGNAGTVGDTNVSSTCKGPAFDTQAWDQKHLARTSEFPSAAVDGQGNIDVVWNGQPSPSQGIGPSTIQVATLSNGGAALHLHALRDIKDKNNQLLIQWQPSIAYAGGSNGLAVGYFQVIQLASGSYEIQRRQVTATASATPTFGTPQMISSVSWKPPLTNTPGADPCYEGDYSGAASEANANVVWSYWGDSRNKNPNGAPEQDIYGLYTAVP